LILWHPTPTYQNRDHGHQPSARFHKLYLFPLSYILECTFSELDEQGLV
jgi:hypothetical protein